MIQEVFTAVLEPLTKSETWYGVWFALALRKEIYKTVRVGASKIRDRVQTGEDDEG